jgi:AIPR protein
LRINNRKKTLKLAEATVATNDQIILDQALDQERARRVPSASKSNFFEMYVIEQLLKDADLSDEEIESGLVGDGGDGGIDGIYVFANGDLVREDFDASSLKKSVVLEVVIIQSKLSPGFDEDTLNRFIAVTNDLFDLSKTVDNFAQVYNEGVRSAIGNFRSVYKDLAARFPSLQFRYVYASRGDSQSVHQNVSRKVKILEKAVLTLFSSAKFSFDFIGASNLLSLARRQPITSFDLKVSESISAQGGYIALVRLKEFEAFIRDDNKQLRKNLFEANVRDYQGATQVNDEIQKSLSAKGSEDFWWLNNGVTIIAAKAVQSGKTLTIEDPQIVNGLQTSTEIYKYFSSANTEGDERSVMVRVIVPGKGESSDRIIKATNSQTTIPPASLRATDKVHRDIEEYLKPFGLFYDRRKNMHKNEGRAVEQIISIPLMAQSIMSICMQRPDDARARPSSLLKRDDDYAKIFNPEHPIELFLLAGSLVKAVQSNLRSRDDLQPKDRNNLLFYIVMHVAACLAGKARPSVKELSTIKVEEITARIIDGSFKSVKARYDALGASDAVAKGTQLLLEIKSELECRFPEKATSN